MQKKIFQTLLIGASILLPGINLAANSSCSSGEDYITVTNVGTGGTSTLYPGENGSACTLAITCTNASGCQYKISGRWVKTDQTSCNVSYNNHLGLIYYSNLFATISCNYSPPK